jgi:transcriptional regulator GlxA family with amidase domain
MPQRRSELFASIDAALSETPGARLVDLSHSLGTDRHNIENAVLVHRGVTFREFHKQKRLAHAKELLKNEGLSVKEVSAELGYRSAQAFSRFCKAATGRTPSSLRCKRTSP